MANVKPLSVLDEAIQEAEQHVSALRALRALTESNPVLVKRLAGQLAGLPNGSHQKTRIIHPGEATVFGRVRAFYKEHDNAWAPVENVVRGAGLGRSAVANVLYRTHRQAFDKKDNPKGGKSKLWRLKTESEVKQL